MTETTDAAEAATPRMCRPVPGNRQKGPSLDGSPVEIDGQTWTLSAAIPELSEVWDRIYDHAVVRGSYDERDVQLAALRLLQANYRLDLDEAVQVVLSADPADLVPPVEVALFGVDRPYRGYSEWVEVSLLANGIDPAGVPPDRRRAVVEYLAAQGRAIPADEYLSSHKAAAKRKSILDFAARRAERKAPCQ
ncbi:MAG: hypothetical protein ABI353_08550 [Isosphaeraceae bacterium]